MNTDMIGILFVILVRSAVLGGMTRGVNRGMNLRPRQVGQPQCSYDKMLSSYPILRDKRCEEGGGCMAYIFKDECDICENTDCQQQCSQKRSNNEDIMSFIKNYAEGGRKKFEYIQGDPKRYLQDAKRITVVTRSPEVVTTTVNEVKTVTVDGGTVVPEREEESEEGVEPRAKPKRKRVKKEKAKVKPRHHKKVKPRHHRKPPSSPSEETTCNCMKKPEIEDCEAKCRRSKGKAKHSKKGKAKHRKDSESSPSSSSPSSSPTSPPQSVTPHDPTPPAISTRPTKDVTVTRLIEKFRTVEKPITLYREMTTTVVKEKPIINYKVTTFTDYKTESVTVTRTVGGSEKKGEESEEREPKKVVPEVKEEGEEDQGEEEDEPKRVSPKTVRPKTARTVRPKPKKATLPPTPEKKKKSQHPPPTHTTTCIDLPVIVKTVAPVASKAVVPGCKSKKRTRCKVPSQRGPPSKRVRKRRTVVKTVFKTPCEETGGGRRTVTVTTFV